MKTIRMLGFWVCLAMGLGSANLEPANAPPGREPRPAVGEFSATTPWPTSAPSASAPPHRLGRDRPGSRPSAGADQPAGPGGLVPIRARGSCPRPRTVAGRWAWRRCRTWSGSCRAAIRALPAVLVMSHYDSVHNSPGAADDSLGAAAALEIARALKAGPQPARDVIFLFTDGEEAGLLGAEAFFARDPLLRPCGRGAEHGGPGRRRPGGDVPDRSRERRPGHPLWPARPSAVRQFPGLDRL
jgi:hypothetical protein